MATTNIYLSFNGNCREAFNFYKSVFGIEFSYISRFGDIPENENYKVTDAYSDKIMHVAIPIGSSILMGSDCGEEQAALFRQGNNFSVSLTADSREQADSVFMALSEGGEVSRPMNDTFWGDYFGMIRDRFGVSWMISYNEENI